MSRNPNMEHFPPKFCKPLSLVNSIQFKAVELCYFSCFFLKDHYYYFYYRKFRKHVQIFAGTHQLWNFTNNGSFIDENIQKRKPKSIKLHPSFDNDIPLPGDIALITVSPEFTINEFVRPVCLPTAGNYPIILS